MKQYFHRLCMVTGLLCMCASGIAQSYTFTKDAGVYHQLTGATRIPFTDFDPQSGLYHLKELTGETFYFYGLPFALDTASRFFFIQDAGNLRIDNDSSLVIVDGAFTYLDSIDLQSSISYKIEGTPGNKVLKVQWQNLKIRSGKMYNFVNFQIHIYQRTGIAEVHYGPSAPSNASGFGTGNGPMAGMFYSPLNFSGCYEKLWLNGTPPAITVDSNANYFFQSLRGFPSEGTIYRFTPRFLVGVKEPKGKSGFLMYPNPVKDVLYINEPNNWAVYDVRGKLMWYEADASVINMNNLPAGLYVLRNPEGVVVKVIKE